MLEITAGLAMGYLTARSKRQVTRQRSATISMDAHADEGSPVLAALHWHLAAEFDMVPGRFTCQVNVWKIFFLKGFVVKGFEFEVFFRNLLCLHGRRQLQKRDADVTHAAKRKKQALVNAAFTVCLNI